MHTLLGALLGFISSAFPDLLRYFREDKDRVHELAIMDRQIEISRLGHSQRLEEINVQSETTEKVALYNHAKPVGVKWVDALSASVRPIITYAFFLLYAGVKIAGWIAIISAAPDMSWSESIVRIWRDEDEALFAAVMSFWFGHRALRKRR